MCCKIRQNDLQVKAKSEPCNPSKVTNRREARQGCAHTNSCGQIRGGQGQVGNMFFAVALRRSSVNDHDAVSSGARDPVTVSAQRQVQDGVVRLELAQERAVLSHCIQEGKGTGKAGTRTRQRITKDKAGANKTRPQQQAEARKHHNEANTTSSTQHVLGLVTPTQETATNKCPSIL